MGNTTTPDSPRKGGGGDVIKFGKARKSLAREAKSKKAAENRARHGEKAAAKDKRAALLEKLQSNLDGHKRDTKPTSE